MDALDVVEELTAGEWAALRQEGVWRRWRSSDDRQPDVWLRLAIVDGHLACTGMVVEPPTRETVGEYLAGWLGGVRGEYAPGAYDAARLHVERYIIPRLGAVRLSELTTPIVKAFYADVAEHGRIRGDRPLSAKTVHNIHRTLSRALNDAVAELPPRIVANPAAKAHKAPPSPEQAVDRRAAPHLL